MQHALFGFISGETPPASELAKVRRVYANGTPMKLAWLLDMSPGDWITHDGMRVAKDAQDEIIARVRVYAGAWEALFWEDTDLLDATRESGWLSPEGLWYGCRPVWHDTVAKLVFRQSEDALGTTFARVRDREYTTLPSATGRLTEAQAAWINARGYRVGQKEDYARREAAAWVAKSGRPLRRDRGSGD